MRHLTLGGSFSSNCVLSIGKCPSLEELNLSYSNIRDEAIKRVAAQWAAGDFPSLKELNLDNTAITDDCASAIDSIQTLRSLSISSTNLSNEKVSLLMEHIHSRNK
jgi:hypothetical protein